MNKNTTDGLVAGGLALALLLVFVLDRMLSGSGPQPTPPGPITPAAAPKPLRLAVSTTDKDVWDDMTRLLDEFNAMGQGKKVYDYKVYNIRELYDQKRWEEFDVLFLTCSSVGNDKAVADNARAFVARGGTLYASDWRYKVVADAFPDFKDPRAPVEGLDNLNLQAEIVDPALKDILGERVTLSFDLDQWKPAWFHRDKVKVMMTANIVTMQRDKVHAPLLVQFSFNRGNVIFTSFHNRKINSEIAKKLLNFLVFSALTAQEDNKVNQTFAEGGFSPKKSNLFSASSGNAKADYTYQSSKAGSVSFALTFPASEGAKLKMTVTSPDGAKKEQEGLSPFTLTVDSSKAGEWRYTVEALSVPHDNFNFRVTVAEK